MIPRRATASTRLGGKPAAANDSAGWRGFRDADTAPAGVVERDRAGADRGTEKFHPSKGASSHCTRGRPDGSCVTTAPGLNQAPIQPRMTVLRSVYASRWYPSLPRHGSRRCRHSPGPLWRRLTKCPRGSSDCRCEHDCVASRPGAVGAPAAGGRRRHVARRSVAGDRGADRRPPAGARRPADRLGEVGRLLRRDGPAARGRPSGRASARERSTRPTPRSGRRCTQRLRPARSTCCWSAQSG